MGNSEGKLSKRHNYMQARNTTAKSPNELHETKGKSTTISAQ
jgi:hypothetical protein